MTESLEARAARYLSAHVVPRDQPRPPRLCSIKGCDTPGRLYPRGVLCPDHEPAAPSWAPSSVASPSDTMPPRSYGTATTDPRPGR